ncbi:MAG: hypothetical protein KAS67_01055 [Thermoplasmata archaeon]|nr:hypothetical protein [Thermoplasmata archaeon]
MGRDIYSDLSKIEERGKRKKKKGFLSSLKGDKESGEEAAPVQTISAMSQESKPVEPKSKPVRSKTEHEPEKDGPWAPLKGKQLKHAKDKLMEYKRMLERTYKAGKLTKEECRQKSKAKEIELGISPPGS